MRKLITKLWIFLTPWLDDSRLADKLFCVLAQEIVTKSELFDYLCWLEEKQQKEAVPDTDFIVLASDGRTFWGESYSEALAKAMQHDKAKYEEETK